MPRALCITGTVIAALLLALFGFDLAIGFPLGGVNSMMDIGMLVAAVMLGYGSWHTLREQV